MNIKYTKQHFDFARKCLNDNPHITWGEITNKAEKEFSTSFNELGYRRACNNHNIHALHKNNRHEQIFSAVRLEWIKEQLLISPKITVNQITEKFNMNFNVNVKPSSLKKRANENGIFFGKKASQKSIKTLREYVDNVHTKSIGHERVKSGYCYIKVTSDSFKKFDNYIPKHRYVWTQVHGEIPEDCLIVFLDGDTLNTDIENLYCIKKGVFRAACKHGLWSDIPERNLTLLKLYELIHELRKVRI